MEPFKLQLLHLADQEAGIPALDDAPRASAVINALKDDYENTLLLSSGDAIIPGLFFSASADAFGGAGRADIAIQNELGIQAIAFGNHEFDLGTSLIRDLVKGGEDDPETPDIDESFIGAQFPYLSSNLDFTTSEDLADLVVPDDQAPVPNSIAATTVIDVNGEKIGVVGATTPTLPTISSPGDVTVLPADFDGMPTSEQLDTLAAEIQKDVDELLAANPDLNKVVLLAHMQQISIEQALATRLTNVDVIVAGGSNTRLFDEDDRVRPGDTVQGEYPIFTTDAAGEPIAIVNTDGNYKYIGRLVIDFDENGNIIPESYDATVSGAYATDAEGVAALGAEGLVDPEIQQIVDTLEDVIIAKESNVFGISDVYLNGLRDRVRTEETNLGNLTADANLAIAKEIDESVVISLKNGGGIRDDIGQVIVPPGGTGEPELLPNEAIPGVKPTGGISETDIGNTLRFNNGLTLLTITAAELLAVIEHGVSASAPDDSVTAGQFPQVAGIEFSFDLTAPAGDRVQSLVVLDEEGNDADVIVQNGELVGEGDRTFRMVTLGFLAGGGDGYLFPERDVVDITQPEDAARTGAATFAPDGSEQDALAEYLAANFGADNPFNQADTDRAEDTRIQNLAFRADTVIDGGMSGGDGESPVAVGIELLGTGADETLTGTEGDDLIAGFGGADVIAGKGGDDILRGDGSGRSSSAGGAGGDDIIFGGMGSDRIGGKGGNDRLFGEEGDDMLWGDDGDDLLRGGLGNDILTGDDSSGGMGSDTFVFAIGEGTDIITDFEVGIDFIGLAGGLSFGQISITESGGDAMILVGDEILAMVLDTSANVLSESAFMAIA
ncbi:MAG: 5'-nucleotidase C-terminal domain-containing protein [Phormidesmis sp.]